MSLLFLLMLAGYASGADGRRPASRYLVQSIEYRSVIVPWFERDLSEPVMARLNPWAIRARAAQSDFAHPHLTYCGIVLPGLMAMLLVRGT